MAGRSVSIILLAVSVVAANTCPRDPIDWSCSDPPHLTLKFPTVNVISCDQIHDKVLFEKPVHVSFSGNTDPGTTYTLVMVDPDAPNHAKGEAWLHWIRAGLTGEDLASGTMHTGQDIKAYAPPTPPKGTGVHRYFVFLFEETQDVKKETIERKKFKLDNYLKQHSLCGPVASNMFRTQY